jgi:hypothetical protein
LRKLRSTGSGSGKRGGRWVIYDYLKDDELILMSLIHRKNETEDLTKDHLKILSSLVKGDLL